MKKIILFFILFVMFGSCTNSKKKEKKAFVLEYNSKKIEKAGQVLYVKFCIECHGNKDATDNFFASNIRNDKYELNFLANYINHQDSLLQNKDELVLKIKEEWNNINYIHNFNLTEQEIKAISYYLKE